MPMPPHSVTLHFLKPGMHTLIEDLGRAGHQDAGVPVGGVLDKTSAAAANQCVGNDSNEPVLEITMQGPQITFDTACQVAITGADMSPKLNGKAIQSYTRVEIPAGATLSFGKLRKGCRAYLAVRGTWQVKKWLGSASALTLGDEDLVPGAVIKKDARIEILLKPGLSENGTHAHDVPSWPDTWAVHVLPGPEFRFFTAEHIAFFFNTAFTLTADSNRIGYRLDPPLPDYAHPQELISSGVLPGTVQVTRQGQPVILMADAQTTGGYPRIANVLASDMDHLAQLKPGDLMRFQIVKQT